MKTSSRGDPVKKTPTSPPTVYRAYMASIPRLEKILGKQNIKTIFEPTIKSPQTFRSSKDGEISSCTFKLPVKSKIRNHKNVNRTGLKNLPTRTPEGTIGSS